jgi:hypothetical protein
MNHLPHSSLAGHQLRMEHENDDDRIRSLTASSRSLKELIDDAQQLHREIDRHVNDLRRAGQPYTAPRRKKPSR